MMEIWKYPLMLGSTQIIEMPANAVILTIQVQQGIPCIWALVDPTKPLKAREFNTYGTGWPLKDVDNYIGTYQTDDGLFVWHVFERLND